MRKHLSVYFPGILLFFLALLVGLFTYKDYGIGWDEPAQRLIGTVNYNYVTQGDQTLLSFVDKEYGPGFEIPLVFFEKLLGLNDTMHVYHMRHLVAHTFFLLGAFFGYMLVYKLFRNQFLACLGFTMFVFAPRIYAHSFFNTKDIPFSSMFLIALTVCKITFEKRKPYMFLLLGILCGYTTSIRIMGIIPAFLIFLFILTEIFFTNKETEKNKRIFNPFFFLIGFSVCLYAASPYLWKSPVANLIESYTHASGRLAGDVLFMGKFESSMKLPWFYVPVWIGITTPIMFLIAGLYGIILILIDCCKNPARFIKDPVKQHFLLYGACFSAPILAVITLRPVIYDDWRHIYFIYPAFVLLAIYSINSIQKNKYRLLVQVACIVQVAFLGYFMVWNHPFQQVYFNSLVSHEKEYLRKNYDMDYWGVSMKQGLDTLLSRDTSPVIKINNAVMPEVINNQMLLMSVTEKKRIMLVNNDEDADYRIVFFRAHPEDYNYPRIFYEIRVLNSTILRIYKLH